MTDGKSRSARLSVPTPWMRGRRRGRSSENDSESNLELGDLDVRGDSIRQQYDIRKGNIMNSVKQKYISTIKENIIKYK